MRLPLALAAGGVLALAIAGPAALGKLALLAGLPGLAAPLISAPAIKGVALYRAGDHRGADLAFRDLARDDGRAQGLDHHRMARPLARALDPGLEQAHRFIPPRRARRAAPRGGRAAARWRVAAR